jgi:hypothetical protein
VRLFPACDTAIGIAGRAYNIGIGITGRAYDIVIAARGCEADRASLHGSAPAAPSGRRYRRRCHLNDSFNNRVLKLPAGASAQTMLPFTGLSTGGGVAVDSAGDVYFADFKNHRLLELPAGATSQTEVRVSDPWRPAGVAGPTSRPFVLAALQALRLDPGPYPMPSTRRPKIGKPPGC